MAQHPFLIPDTTNQYKTKKEPCLHFLKFGTLPMDRYFFHYLLKHRIRQHCTHLSQFSELPLIMEAKRRILINTGNKLNHIGR